MLVIGMVTPVTAGEKWDSQMWVEGSKSGGKIGFLVPLVQGPDSLLYADFRGMFATEDVREFNLGFGYRKIIGSDSSYILGGYIFGDRRRELDEDWNQLTLGAEYLKGGFEARLNAYIPSEKRVLSESAPDDAIIVDGTSVYYQEANLNRYYQAMDGYDLEVGNRFDSLPGKPGLFVKGFKFTGKDMNDITGTSLRLDTLFEKKETKWNIGVEWLNDNIDESQLKASIGVQVPLSIFNNRDENASEEKKRTSLEERMIEPAERDVDIVIRKTNAIREVVAEGTALDPDTNVEVRDIWFVTAEGEGDGTRKNPTSLESLAELGANENDIIVVLADEGDIDTGDSGFQLLNGQKILSPGGGYLILNSSMTEGRSARYEPTGEQSTLVNTPYTDILLLADNTTVSGIRFNLGQDSIDGKDIGGIININNNLIVNSDNEAIEISNSNRVTALNIKDNTIYNSGEDSIEVYLHNQENELFRTSEMAPEPESQPEKVAVAITGNTIGNTEDEDAIDVYIEDFKANVTVADNTVNHADENGIHINGNYSDGSIVKVSGNKVNDADENGVHVHGNYGTASQVIVTDNIVNYADENGIHVHGRYGDGSELIVSDNTVNYAEENGVHLHGRHSEKSQVTVSGNKVEYADDNGIHIHGQYGDESSLTVSDNTVDLAEYTGINVEGEYSASSKVQISGNKVERTEGSGIAVYANYLYSEEYNEFALASDGQTTVEEIFTLDIASNDVGNAYGNGILAEVIGGPATVNVSDNTIGSVHGYGYDMSPQVFEASDGSTCCGNGISVETSSAEQSILSVTGNTIEYAENNGIDIVSALNNLDVDINNNTIKSAGNSGIALNSVFFSDIKADISSNTIDDAGTAGISYNSYFLSILEAEVYDNLFGNGVVPEAIDGSGTIIINGEEK